jgi:hypothetical protein
MNIRWDLVVDRKPADGGTPPPCRSRLGPDHGGGRIAVRVQLFGALAVASEQRSLALELPAGATVRDVLATLGHLLGETFLVHVLDAGGAKRRYCRLFVGGYPVEDLQMPLGATAEIDIILLIAPEGG